MNLHYVLALITFQTIKESYSYQLCSLHLVSQRSLSVLRKFKGLSKLPNITPQNVMELQVILSLFLCSCLKWNMFSDYLNEKYI